MYVSKSDLKQVLAGNNFQKNLDILADKYSGKKVLVYGTGALFFEIAENYDISKINIIGVSDKKIIEQDTEINGYKAIIPKNIPDYNPDVVLISVINHRAVSDYLKNEVFPAFKGDVIFDKFTDEKLDKELGLPDEKKEIAKEPCHYNSLFINHDGDIFPCCSTWNNESLKIGHISDTNKTSLITNFNKYCRCEGRSLRKAEPEEKLRSMNIELSLLCQAKCAMCCVDAPNWRGKYDYYGSLTEIIDFFKPESILLQGGEVLIQKKSVEWLYEIKHKYPDIKLSLITNGNVEREMVKVVDDLFDFIIVSMVGFQPETYKKTMGLEIEKTKNFIQTLLKTNKTKVNLKYLVTPLGMHETHLFLNWAINIKPYSLYVMDANTSSYINNPKVTEINSFNYWNKIIERSTNDFKSSIINNKLALLENNAKIYLDSGVKKFYHIDAEFVSNNGLDDIIGDI